MGCFSAGIFLFLLWFIRSKLTIVSEIPVWSGITLGVCFFTFIIYKPKRAISFFGWKHFLNYPPIWLSTLLGASIVFLLIGYFPCILSSLKLSNTFTQIFRWFGFGTILIAYTTWLIRIIWELHEKDYPDDIPKQIQKLEPRIFTSYDKLVAWISNDLPIEKEEDAIFEHCLAAQRMASRMVCKPTPTQALVGSLGSGKTTILKLVKNALKFEKGGSRIKIVSIELWPYETSRAAVEGILGKLIEALSEEVNVIGLRGLPESYTEAMSALGGFWSVLARLHATPPNPFEILNRINEIAEAIGITYIVWVEDLERFADGNPNSSDQKILKRLNPIRALLYGLDQLESVSVVTATTSLNLRFDLEKIARFVEKVPEVKKMEASQILGLFRDGCLLRDVIDPVTPETRKQLEFTTDPEVFERLMPMINLDKNVFGPNQALLVLCETPRTLKQGLRRCLDAWNRLAGEIDFDDLLIMSILRETEPGTFAHIDKYIFDLRVKNSDKDPRADFRNALEALQISEIKKEAINEIVKFVFDEVGKPQGLARNGHVDYWRRFQSLPTITPDESDQFILSAMLDKDDDKLLTLLENPKTSVAVEDFADVIINGIELLGTERRFSLFIPWVKRRCKEKPRFCADRIPGFIPIWRLWIRKSEDGSLKAPDALNLIKKAYDIAVPQKLSLVAEIEHYYVVPDGVHNILKDGATSYINDAKTYLRELLLTTYKNQPDKLAIALDGTDTRILTWLCWGLDRVRAQDYIAPPFKDWMLFARTIIEATQLQPKILLPQLACLIINEQQTPPWKKGLHATFNTQQTKALFGDSRKVLNLFKKQKLADWENDTRVQAVIIEAQ